METNINNKRWIYGLTYGYSDTKIYFIATREEYEKFKNKQKFLNFWIKYILI